MRGSAGGSRYCDVKAMVGEVVMVVDDRENKLLPGAVGGEDGTQLMAKIKGAESEVEAAASSWERKAKSGRYTRRRDKDGSSW
jgi:hypothetical protein